MIFVFLAFGFVLMVTAINGNAAKLGGLLKEDILGGSGTDVGYIRWFIAIVVIGGIGYVKPLKGLSDAFLLLLILVLFLKTGGGLFEKLDDAIKTAKG